MKPHTLRQVQTVPPTASAKFKALGPIAARHGKIEKGAVLPDTQVPACPRVKVADLPDGFIPEKYFHSMEHNQLLSHCCRHPENHEIEARKSHPDEEAPDIYIFHCSCGKKHTRWLIGSLDDVARPIWDAS